MRSRRQLLTRVGWIALLVLGAIALGLVVLHHFNVINAWRFPAKPVAAVLLLVGMGGVLVGRTSGQRPRTGQYPRIGQRPKSRRWLRRVTISCVVLLLVVNLPSYLLAYHSTHVRPAGQWGLGVPKPQNKQTPGDRGLPYTTHRIPLNAAQPNSGWLEAWSIPAAGTSKGTVLLFPGNLGTKGGVLISPAASFRQLGYDTLLVDFQGVGGSSGTTTTAGIHEAKDVVTALQYARANLPSPVILYGVSMGTAAILRAITLHNLQPDGLILELPFTRLVDAIKIRLRHGHILPITTAELLVFWGGVQHGFNGFDHNPIDFAKAVRCPVLLIHGQRDQWMTVSQIQALFHNFPSPKQLVIAPNVGHELLVSANLSLWQQAIEEFLPQIKG